MATALPLLAINWSSPIFWAVMIGWIISVTLHEFAHGVVAYLGGDYTIRERGGLTLNPLHYANPVMTLVIPLVFLLMGAIPLVGAATYINVNLLRNKMWRSATALAGPLTNLLLFLLCVALLSQKVGWLDPSLPEDRWSPTQIFCGAMTVLQLFACVFNLLPLPPLDGFNVISPYLPPEWVARTRQPQIAMGLLCLLFFVLSSSQAMDMIQRCLNEAMNLLRLDPETQDFIRRSYNIALFGGTN